MLEKPYARPDNYAKRRKPSSWKSSSTPDSGAPPGTRSARSTAPAKIRQNAAKAAQRATNAERKYDRSMLADILAREKQQDLSRHAAPATTPAPARTPAARTATVKASAATTAAKPAESPLHEAPSALAAPPAATPARAPDIDLGGVESRLPSRSRR